jgi:hypothetical protein
MACNPSPNGLGYDLTPAVAGSGFITIDVESFGPKFDLRVVGQPVEAVGRT